MSAAKPDRIKRMEVKEAFKFCPRCGKQFRFEGGHLQCGSCGLSYYLNPKTCANVILVNAKGEYLLSKRAFEPAKGLWDVPGGFVEEDETLEAAAIRELKEEASIDISTDELHYLKSSPQTYLFQGVDYVLLTVTFVAHAPENIRTQAGDDVAELKFFAFEGLPVGRLSYPELTKDIEAAAKFLRENGL